jgi:hypothetical protein
MSPPVPVIDPEYVPLALVSDRFLLPRVTPPVPESDLIDAPAAVLVISNVPLSTTPLDDATDPAPLKDKVPELIVVAPE